jgi:hypothetical protein
MFYCNTASFKSGPRFIILSGDSRLRLTLGGRAQASERAAPHLAFQHDYSAKPSFFASISAMRRQGNSVMLGTLRTLPIS